MNKEPQSDLIANGGVRIARQQKLDDINVVLIHRENKCCVLSLVENIHYQGNR